MSWWWYRASSSPSNVSLLNCLWKIARQIFALHPGPRPQYCELKRLEEAPLVPQEAGQPFGQTPQSVALA